MRKESEIKLWIFKLEDRIRKIKDIQKDKNCKVTFNVCEMEISDIRKEINHYERVLNL